MAGRAFHFRESGDGQERCDYCHGPGAIRYTMFVHFFIRLCASCKARFDLKLGK